MQNGPAANRLFYRRDIFKETVMEEESHSLLANNDSDYKKTNYSSDFVKI